MHWCFAQKSAVVSDILNVISVVLNDIKIDFPLRQLHLLLSRENQILVYLVIADCDLSSVASLVI